MILTRVKTKSIDFDFIINQKLSDNKIHEILFIVPTNRKVRNLKKELISYAPNQSVYKLKIETLGTLSTKLLSRSKSFHSISEAASTVFIKQICSQLKLRYLSVYREEIPPGTLDKIRNVISEYKRQGITADILRKEALLLEENEKNKALDIADIYAAYSERCEKINAFDIGDIYKNLNLFDRSFFRNNFDYLYAPVEYIFLDGFSEFTQPEIEIVNSLADCSGLFIGFDYDTKNDFLFSHLEKCFSRLTKFNFVEIADSRSSSISGFQNLVKENLFISRNPNQRDYKEKIFRICGYDKEKEIELIAKQIKLILLNDRAEAHKICLAFNLVQEYSSIVKDVFAKIGIPFNLTDRTPLQNSNPVSAIVNFLEIAENDFYFKNVFRGINGGFIDLDEIDTANLYRVATENKIVSGRENWIKSIEDVIANLVNTGYDDELNHQRSSLRKAKKDIEKLTALLKPFEEKMTISEFQKRLKDFIATCGLPLRLLKLGEDKESNIRGIAEFMEIVAEIFDLQKEEIGDEIKLPLSYFMEQIRTACGWARFNVKEKSDYGVLVTSLEEIRGLKFDYLFIGGLCDGLFPTRFNPEIFSSGTYKKQAFIHQTEERFLFYRALCSWQRKLFLAYHLTDGGRGVVKSNFLKEFETVFSTEKLSEANFIDSLFCDEEVQIEYGRKSFGESDNVLPDKIKSNIKKSLAIEKKRIKNPFDQSAFTGSLISDDDLSITKGDLEEIKGILSGYLKKQYSISQLEMYAKCPFKYFTEKVLGIETFEEPTEDVEAVEMGRLLHTILFDFYTELRKQKIVLQQCSESDFLKSKKLIFKIAEKHLQNTAFRSPLAFYEKEKILGLGGNENESVLYRFIEYERNSGENYIPQFFEVGFGRLRSEEADDSLSVSEPVNVDGIKLRGKIDRIEVDESDSSFNVVDYKLGGSKPTFNDLKEGISLQLPLYLYVAAELLTKKFDRKFSPNEMFIYSLKYSSEDFGKSKVSLGIKKETKFNSVDELIGNSLNYIKNYVQQISEGKFNLSKLDDRENKVCRFCQFRLICRIDDLVV